MNIMKNVFNLLVTDFVPNGMLLPKLIVTFFIIFLVNTTYSQDKFYIYTNLSHGFSLNIGHGFLYSMSNASLGGQVNTRHGNITVYATYQFGGNIGGATSYKLNYLALGGGLKYRFLNNERRFSPYFEVGIMTELATSYRNGYLNMVGFHPQNSPQRESFSYSHSDPVQYRSYSRFYHSTPLISSIILGADIRLVNGLYFDFGLGYGIRGMKTKWYDWEGTDDLSQEKIEQLPIEIQWFNMLDVKLGLSYAFSLKKNKATTN